MTERHVKILEILTENRRIEVAVLSKMLEVSQVTIRKDLDYLEEQRLIRREHGFASLENIDDTEKRMAFHYSIKRRIANFAAKTVKDGETVMIESGSCCALLAEELANTRRDVTIITNSVFIANHLRRTSYSRVILLGGYYQRDSQVLVGSITHKCAESFFSSKFFIGAGGFTEKIGFTGNDHERAQTIQALAEQSTQVIVLTESEKFQNHGAVGLVDTANITALYTDDRIPQDKEAFLLKKNIAVTKVPSGGPCDFSAEAGLKQKQTDKLN
jgi:DeoR/GlpR family transcriptional regulator of sugar metabolism